METYVFRRPAQPNHFTSFVYKYINYCKSINAIITSLKGVPGVLYIFYCIRRNT